MLNFRGVGTLLKGFPKPALARLDICWAYALLGDANYLPDAEAGGKGIAAETRGVCHSDWVPLSHMSCMDDHAKRTCLALTRSSVP